MSKKRSSWQGHARPGSCQPLPLKQVPRKVVEFKTLKDQAREKEKLDRRRREWEEAKERKRRQADGESEPVYVGGCEQARAEEDDTARVALQFGLIMDINDWLCWGRGWTFKVQFREEETNALVLDYWPSTGRWKKGEQGGWALEVWDALDIAYTETSKGVQA